jgi:hypothetical protein
MTTSAQVRIYTSLTDAIWLSRYRRLNTIFERTDTSLIAFVRIAFISILACRLHRLETAENHA